MGDGHSQQPDAGPTNEVRCAAQTTGLPAGRGGRRAAPVALRLPLVFSDSVCSRMSPVAPPAGLQAALAHRYVIERELGSGGMATVYLARDLKHSRFVALKVLSPVLAASLGADRFLREIELAARLQHPHIVTVFDSGDAG